MSDSEDNKPKDNQCDDEERTRDEEGRWLPGYCPNPKGRPKKKKRPKIEINQADLQHFGNTLIDIYTNGERNLITRREALLQKMFETAMKGKVTAQRFLYNEFKNNDEMLARARAYLEELRINWIINNPNYAKRGFQIPFEIEVEMARLEALLHHYFPSTYPNPNPSEADDDGEEKDE